MSGNLNQIQSKQICMKKAKDVAKQMGMSFNDLVLGIMSKSIKRHFIAMNDPTDQISVACPITFKRIPENTKDYWFGNRFATVTIYLSLQDDFKKACKINKERTEFMKNSFILAGTFTGLSFYCTFLPHLFMVNFYKECGSKHSFFLSNIPGYLKPVYYGGKPAKRMFLGLLTACGNIATGVTCVSICGRT